MSIVKQKITFNSLLIYSSLPRLETELLVSFLLKKSREFLMTHPDTPISPSVLRKFKELERKRLKDWPIAYLTGHKEFYGFDFKVTPAVLTPRPETELIVDEIINSVKENHLNQQKPLIIDLGTGTGAIIISIASELRRLFPLDFKNTKFKAVDISPVALKVAKQNAKTHKLNKEIIFFHGNLLAPLKLTSKKLVGHELIIAANLPYLTKRQIKESPTISREPKLALDGGKDGLKYYQELFKQLVGLNLTGIRYQILCEIDPSQNIKIKALTKKYFPDARIGIKKDLTQKNRLALIKKSA